MSEMEVPQKNAVNTTFLNKVFWEFPNNHKTTRSKCKIPKKPRESSKIEKIPKSQQLCLGLKLKKRSKYSIPKKLEFVCEFRRSNKQPSVNARFPENLENSKKFTNFQKSQELCLGWKFQNTAVNARFAKNLEFVWAFPKMLDNHQQMQDCKKSQNLSNYVVD